ncbi:CLUMA_CG003178, isoform A [Clunio marinus]|uniref:CLUMA_CG003178, isoform A n=1 Tax=Clunio marinus TaxID=568069 RepID=A0A1J1HMZ8_9DIPT|nr:CLUMA_CG003178, isoform A [Clunio marinus]
MINRNLLIHSFIVFFLSFFTASTNCVFPQQWNGSWFQSGEQQPITFSGSTMSSRGRCVASEGDKYLLVNEKDCKRCVVIYEKHQNVLQYKESECELEQNKPASAAISSVIRSDYNTDSRFQGNEQYLDPESGRELLNYYCEQIPGDAMLYSMFKIDSEPVKCPGPLKGQFAFTYNRGHGECKNPISKIKSCTEDTRMMLNFQACPDVDGTESTVEELTCLATWKDNNAHYIVGTLSHSLATSNEERFRCFVYEKINTNSGKHGSKDVEYRLAQSGDATCSGLENSEYGSRIMTLKRFGPAERCDFPKWFKEPKHWHSLNGELSYNVHQKNDGTIHITKEKPTQRLESRAVCEQINKQTANETIMVVEQTTGCNTGFLCLVIYRRDTHVVELQIGNLTSRLEDACAPDHYDVSRTPFTTLLAAAPTAESQECPLSGSYTLTGPLGPPYMMSRHKRNHINGSKQHHHNAPTRHDVLSFRNADMFEHNLHPYDRLNNQRHRRDLSKCMGAHKQRRRLSIGCSRDDIVEVHPQCSEAGDEEYVCHGSWTENDTTFIIARHAGTKHGVCISFKPSTTDSTAAQLIVGDSCYRETMSSEIPEHHLISNVTGIVRKCGDTSSSSKLSNYSLLISLTSWTAIILFRQQQQRVIR